MKRIFKYPVPIQDEFQLELPYGTKILTFQMQQGKACVWALIDDTEYTTRFRNFRIVGTGHPIDDAEDLIYIGTAQEHGGVLVWHLFEKRG